MFVLWLVKWYKHLNLLEVLWNLLLSARHLVHAETTLENWSCPKCSLRHFFHDLLNNTNVSLPKLLNDSIWKRSLNFGPVQHVLWDILTHDLLVHGHWTLFKLLFFYCNSWWILILHLFCSPSQVWQGYSSSYLEQFPSSIYWLTNRFVFLLSVNNFSYISLILSVLWSWWEYWNETIIIWVTSSLFLCCSSLTFQQINILKGWYVTISFGNLLCQLSTALFVLWYLLNTDI